MNLKTYLSRLKRKVLKKPFLKNKHFPAYWFDQLLGNKEAFIVQIGSNDGKTGDPLNQLLMKNKKWKALFVEPVPYLFDRLESNYSDSHRFACENVAINEGDKIDFYWIDPKAKFELIDLPFWYEQLGSFNKQHIIDELGDKVKPFILSQELEGISLKALLQRNKVIAIDLLHIDTEGYDWKILSQLNLSIYSPQFILYEINHLSKEDLEASNDFLKEKYFLFDMGIDRLAINKCIEVKDINMMKKNLTEINI